MGTDAPVRKIYMKEDKTKHWSDIFRLNQNLPQISAGFEWEMKARS